MDSRKSYFLESVDQQPIIVTVGWLRDQNSGTDSRLGMLGLEFFDGITQKKIKRVTLPLHLKYISRVAFRQFPDGYLYFIIDEQHLGRISSQTLHTELLALEQLPQHPELSPSIAKINFDYFRSNFGFSIVNNEGEKLYYYPIIDKIFTYKDLYKVSAADRKDFNDTLGLEFFAVKNAERKETYQLLRYIYQTKSGWPVDTPRMEYDEKNNLAETRWSNERSRMTSFQVLVPERRFFNPRVLDFNDSELLIAYKMTPASDASYVIQVLNAETGAVIWTYHVTDDSKMYYPDSGKILNKGCFVDFGREVVFFNKQGQVITEK